jgi:xanthine/uracil/vitamin C permease (AzgA family)
MEIIKTNKELTAKELYFLTMSPKIQKMKDAVGTVVEIQNYALYKDTNNDKEQTVLAISTPDNEVYATNSSTFIRTFFEMIDVFAAAGETVPAIEVATGTSKAGRTYITCVYSD